ncbi:hypothetical protein [Campylobacter geochelonis]|uniref:Integral membrane protein n=1 Tax=Campylobacter geochelonis TaxID=1780362 RepID=A0A128ENS3_9BACT|nr:hypothetical protein [Campylobacter geochelonis]QKF70857.1 putative membrane protein [Campylobacter geochelonis]CZE47483.1 integral membrane protein [Campylobacter geochelonis]CZE48002.1 integral membrane protein [Campylobacter geochelonis]CZE50622.1 integral membrane protein [Campylobacter geochelonis]
MRYIIAIVLLLFIIVLFSVDDEKLSKKVKFSIVGILAFIAVFGYFYEGFVEKKSLNLQEIALSFNQNKTLVCKGYDINQTNFNFSYATSSFIAKKGVSDKFKDVMVDAKDCKIKDEK